MMTDEKLQKIAVKGPFGLTLIFIFFGFGVGAPTEVISIIVGTIILFTSMPRLIQLILRSRKG